MMSGARLLLALGCLGAVKVSADTGQYPMIERIAAHFEAQSSRLEDNDAAVLSQFAAKAEAIPGAKLSLLVPSATEPSRARFIAARVAELERRVRLLAGTVEIRRSPDGFAADVLWLALIRPSSQAQEVPSPAVALTQSEGDKPVVEVRRPESPPTLPNTADLRLTDWVIRGVKHPVKGPAYAYVAKLGADDAPRELVERQSDRDFGFVRDISLSREGSWVIHTEIGWIGQDASAISTGQGGR